MENKRFAATVMILMSGILIHGTETKITEQKSTTEFQRQIALRHEKHIFERNKYFRYYKSENGEMERLIKNQQILQDLQSIAIKLKNVIDYYFQKKKELKALYSGVTPCGLDKCENFRDVFPEYHQIEHKECRKLQKDKGLKKWTFKLLRNFHSDVQNYFKSFQELINFEKLTSLIPVMYNFSNETRIKMLHSLQNNIKTLIEEIEVVVANKRLNSGRGPREMAQTILPFPKYETHLIMNEWRVIQKSKESLKSWRKNLRAVYKCWKMYFNCDKKRRLKKLILNFSV